MRSRRGLGRGRARRRVDVRVVGDAGVSASGQTAAGIGQLARNLMDNAIKFSPEGAPVVVRVWRERGPAQVSRSRTLGPGIPKAERDKIFQRFYQVDRSRSKVRPGSGLGLAIVKHIAQLHGAAVDVEGEVGRGSTFLVRFPAAALGPKLRSASGRDAQAAHAGDDEEHAADAKSGPRLLEERDVDEKRSYERNAHPDRIGGAHRDRLHGDREADRCSEARREVDGERQEPGQTVHELHAHDPDDLEDRRRGQE